MTELAFPSLLTDRIKIEFAVFGLMQNLKWLARWLNGLAK